MTIDELISRLEEYRDELGGEAEVRLMTQESWPFENEIRGLASGAEINTDDDPEFNEDSDEHNAEDAVVFIVDGGQRCYGSKRAWEAAH